MHEGRKHGACNVFYFCQLRTRQQFLLFLFLAVGLLLFVCSAAERPEPIFCDEWEWDPDAAGCDLVIIDRSCPGCKFVMNVSSKAIQRTGNCSHSCSAFHLQREDSARAVSIHDTAFADLAHVNFLTIEDFPITSLGPAVFSGLTSLQSLQLKSLGSVLTIEPGAMKGLELLQNLRFTWTNVVSLTAQNLAGLRDLHSLEIDGGIGTIESTAFGVLSNLRKLRLVYPWISNTSDYRLVMPITGNLFSSVAGLTELWIENYRPSTLDLSCVTQLRHLQTLRLGRNGVTGWPNGALAELHDLIELHLEGNSITEIPHDVLVGPARLKVLLLQENEISEIDALTFQGLDHLVKLDLQHNKLSVLPSHAFALRRLRELRLNHNQIVSVLPFAFDGAERLSSLSLQNNSISRLDEWSSTMFRLQSLFLLGNPLACLPTLPSSTVEHDLSSAQLELEACDKVCDGYNYDPSGDDDADLDCDWAVVHNSCSGCVFVTDVTRAGPGVNASGLIHRWGTCSSECTVFHLERRSRVTPTGMSPSAFVGMDFVDVLTIAGFDTLQHVSLNGLSNIKTLALPNNGITTVGWKALRETPRLETLLLADNPLSCLPSIPASVVSHDLTPQQLLLAPCDTFCDTSSYNPANSTEPEDGGDPGCDFVVIDDSCGCKFAVDVAGLESPRAGLIVRFGACDPDCSALHWRRTGSVSPRGIHPTALSGMMSLETLTIERFPHFESFGAGVFAGVPSLRVLYFAGGIQGIEDGAFAHLSQLEVLRLEYPSSWPDDDTVYRLRAPLTSAVFRGLTALKELAIVNLHPTTLTMEVFFGLPSLTVLRVEDAGLQSFSQSRCADGYEFEGEAGGCVGCAADFFAADSTGGKCVACPEGSFAPIGAPKCVACNTSGYEWNGFACVAQSDRHCQNGFEPDVMWAHSANSQCYCSQAEYNAVSATCTGGLLEGIAGSSPSDPILFVGGLSTEACKARCLDTQGCVAIEYSSGGACSLAGCCSSLGAGNLGSVHSIQDRTCSACPRGKSSSDVTNGFCIECEAGKFAGQAAPSCVACDAGADWNGVACVPGLQSLRELHLDGNRLSSPPPFHALAGLEVLSLRRNWIGTVANRAFADVPALRELYLDSNGISTLGNSAELDGLPELEVLSLGHNDLATLPRSVLADKTRLVELHVNHNALSALEPFLFEGLPALRVVKLHSNLLYDLRWVVMEGLTGIHTLFLADNPLSCRPSIFSNVEHVDFFQPANVSYCDRYCVDFDNYDALWNSGDDAADWPDCTFDLVRSAWGSDHACGCDFWHDTSRAVEWGSIYSDYNTGQVYRRGTCNPNCTAVVLDLRYSVCCYPSGMHPNAFVGMEHLLTLAIRCQFETLERSSFRGLSGLTNLGVACFALEIEPGAFEGLERLDTLTFFRGTHVASLPAGSMTGMPQLRVLVFTGGLLNIEPGAFDLPVLKELKIEFPGDIKVNYYRTMSLRHGSFQGLGSLRDLSMTNWRMAGVDVGAFEGLNNLRLLRFSNNGVTLPLQVLDALQQLEELDLSTNYFEELPVALPRLRVLDMRENFITDIPSGWVQGVQNLTVLRLRGNLITALGNDTFWAASRLEELDLGFNLISKIEPTALRGLASLKSLQLPFNFIETIPSKVLAESEHLEFLGLEHNSIRELAQDAFQNLGALTWLQLRENRIRNLKVGQFRWMSKLESLFLYDNEVTSAERGHFVGLRSLKVLGLQRNHITSVSTQVLADSPNLLDLRLHDNRINSLGLRAFSGLKALETLLIHNNEITGFNWEVASGLSTVKVFFISGNPLVCNPVLPRSQVEMTDLVGEEGSRILQLPVCLTYGCRFKLDEKLVGADAQQTIETAARGVETITRLVRPDVASAVDHLMLEGGLYVDRPGGLRCWCTPWESCYVRVGAEAANVSKCPTPQATCHERAQCSETDGSFECTCNAGYESSDEGVTCLDIDECLAGGHFCDAEHAWCFNTDGSFECHCNAGWTSEDGGLTCADVDECASVETPTMAGLVGLWRLSTDASDVSGFNQHMTSSTVSFEKSEVGAPFGDGFAVFDYERSDFAMVSNWDPRMELGDALTVELWVKPHEPRGAMMSMLSLAYGAGSDANTIVLTDGFDTANLDCRILEKAATFDGPPSDSCAPDGRWRHLAYTKTANPNAVRKLYRDGELIATWPDGGNSSFPAGGTLVLGQDQDSLGGGFEVGQAFAGGMTEVRIWNMARSQEQIQDTMLVRLSPVHRTCDASNGVCANTEGSFQCICRAGYETENGGVTCVAGVDECGSGVHNCEAHSACVNTVGSYICACRDGWVFDESLDACMDVDECAEAGPVTQSVRSDRFNNLAAATDGIIDNALWPQSPNTQVTSCADVAYLTVEYSRPVPTTGVTYWQFYSDGRQYCSQSVDLSTTGEFAGEEERVFFCDSYAACGPASASGRTVVVELQLVRFIRIGSSRSSTNAGVVFLEVRPHVTLPTPRACDVELAECFNTIGSFLCRCLPGLGGEGAFQPVLKTVGIENGVVAPGQSFRVSERALARSGYIWHPAKHASDAGALLYTTWSIPVGAGQDFVISSRVLFETLGGTAASFVFWTPIGAQYIGFDGANAGNALFLEGSAFGASTLLYRSRIPYLHPNSWHNITLRRSQDRLDIAIDGVEVISHVYLVVEVSAVSWRPWRASMRLASLTYDELGSCAACALGSFSSQDTDGQCTMCPAGTFGATAGASACTECSATACHVDECATGVHSCDAVRANCSDTVDSFLCECLPGFESTDGGVSCVDGVDECVTAQHNCDAQVSVCINTLGSFECGCMDGLESINGTCVESDECALGLDNCQDAACVNTVGSFVCMCDEGFDLEFRNPVQSTQQSIEGGWYCVDTDECDVAQQPADGLVGMWRLASDTSDFSGYGQHMTSFGLDFDSSDAEAPFADGYAVFGGGDDYAVASDWNPRLCDDDELTVEFWWKPTGPRQQMMSVFSLAYPGSDNAFLFHDGQASTGHDLDCGILEGTSATHWHSPKPDSCATDNKWHHLAFTRGNGQRRLYLDGVENWAWGPGGAAGAAWGSGASLVLGQDQDALGGGFDANQAFAGLLTEVRVWSVVRSQQQIQEMMYVRLFGCGVYPTECGLPGDSSQTGAADSCTNSVGGFECGCAPGWDADGGLGCRDVDECAANAHSCDSYPNTVCVNTAGSFVCVCEAGWMSGNGSACVDVDECSATKLRTHPALVASWPLTPDSTDGVTAADLSGNDQHLTVKNLVFGGNSGSDTPGPLPGGYASFTGAKTSYALVKNFDAQLDSGALTIEFWWKPKAGARQTMFTMVSWAIVHSGGPYALVLHDGDYFSGNIACVARDWHTTYFDAAKPSTCAADGEWHHFAYTKTSNPNPARTLYYDGQVLATWLGGTDTFHARGGWFTLGQQNGETRDYLGGPWYFSEGRFAENTAFEGLMTEVRVWNVARTETEIKEMMYTRLPGTEGYCDSEHAACDNSPGSFECVCNHGFESEDGGASCVAGVDECKAEQDACVNSTCVNTVGSYICACRDGWVFNASLDACVDVDECAVQAVDSAAGLVGLWRLAADGSGTSDVSGYEQHMTNSGLEFRGTDAGAPFLDGYAVFDADGNDHAFVDRWNPRMHSDGAFTVELWWKPLGPRVSFMTVLSLAFHGDEDAFLLTDGFASLDCLPNVFLNADSDCCFGRCCAFAGPGTNLCKTDKAWHHIAYSKSANPNPVRKFYYDGELIHTWAEGSDELFVTGGTLVLGQDQEGVGAGSQPWRAFRGFLTEVRFWNVARSHEQIRGARHTRLFGCGIHVTECGVAPLGQASCSNTDGGYTCSCEPGWASSNGGITCRDVDECAGPEQRCGANAACVNSVGSYACQCAAGWAVADDGVACVDVDECASAAQGPTDGLVAVWPLAADTLDSSGYEQHMTSVGLGFEQEDAGAPFEDGYAVFDSVGDDAALVSNWNPRQCGGAGALTVELWWKPALGSRDSFISIMSLSYEGEAAAFALWDGLGASGSDLDCCFGRDCAFAGPDTNTCQHDGNWHHIAFTKTANPGPVRKFYYDGQLVRTWSTGAEDFLPPGAKVVLGRTQAWDDSGYDRANSYKGFVTEVRVWNVARTQQEIADTMHVRLFGCGVHVTECGSASSAGDHCVNFNGSFACSCDPGFASKNGGQTCWDVDECLDPLNCDREHGQCVNSAGGFHCECDPGYEFEGGGGGTCVDIDECQTGVHNCNALASCSNSDGIFSCSCPPGFSGDGVECIDVDECEEDVDNCDENALCSNDAGGFSCTCRAGYRGDGENCWQCGPGFNQTHVGTTCRDVDECSEGWDNCDGNASCVNGPGSFTCECSQGWLSADGGVTCKYQCEVGCDALHAVCQNTSVAFECVCRTGWESSDGGRSCQDINECELPVQTPLCNASTEVCENRAGYFECVSPHVCSFDQECGAGFVCAFPPNCDHTGATCYKRCVDVDECAAEEDPCREEQHKSLCLNEPGSFQCYKSVKDWCSWQPGKQTALPACAEGYRCMSVSGKHKTTCINIDECLEGRHDCAYNQVCEDRVGSFVCLQQPDAPALQDAEASTVSASHGDQSSARLLSLPVVIPSACALALAMAVLLRWLRRPNAVRSEATPRRPTLKPLEVRRLPGVQGTVMSELMVWGAAAGGASRAGSVESQASDTPLVRLDYLAAGGAPENTLGLGGGIQVGAVHAETHGPAARPRCQQMLWLPNTNVEGNVTSEMMHAAA